MNEENLQVAPLSADLTKCEKVMVLPNIYYLMEYLAVLSQQVDDVNRQIGILKNRAATEDIIASRGQYGAFHLVEVRSRAERNEIDVARFAQEFPNETKLIRDMQRSLLTAKHDRAVAGLNASPITLGTADEVLGRIRVTKFTGMKPQTIRYTVEKLEGE